MKAAFAAPIPKEHKHLAQSENVLMGIRAISEVIVI